MGISYLGKAFANISSELSEHGACVQHKLSVAFSHTRRATVLNTLEGTSLHNSGIFSNFGSKSFTACSFQATAQCLVMRIKIGRVNTAVQTVGKYFI